MSVLQRFQAWRRRSADRAALDLMGEGGRAQMARDLAHGEHALRDLVGSDKGDALPRLLRALELEPDDIARRDPALIRDMAAVCAGCTEGRQCSRELASGEAAVSYPGYCPNALSLSLLLRDEHAA
jgi:hypothetical protein